MTDLSWVVSVVSVVGVVFGLASYRRNRQRIGAINRCDVGIGGSICQIIEF